MAERAIIWILRLGGVIILMIALTHIVLGPSSIPGAVPVNATLDSEDRFYATIFGGYGAALLWSAAAVTERRGIVRFLMYVMLASGAARLVSLAAVGPPHPLFQFLTVVEFALPLLILALLRRVPDASGAHPTGA